MDGATEIQVLLTGDAANDAQHLAAEFVSQDLAVSPLSEDELARRSAADLATDAVVGFVVNAAYDLVATTVRRGLVARGHEDGDATITPAVGESASTDADEPPEPDGDLAPGTSTTPTP